MECSERLCGEMKRDRSCTEVRTSFFFPGGCAVEQSPPKCVWTATLTCSSGTGWERSSKGCNMRVNKTKKNAITCHETTVPNQFSFKFLFQDSGVESFPARVWIWTEGSGFWPRPHWDDKSRVARPQSAAFTGT